MKRVFEIQKGMEVWLEPIGNNARYHKQPVKGEITSIGRKYFYVSIPHSPHWGNIKFDLEEFRSHYDDNAGFVLYPSYEAFVSEKTRNGKIREIESAMQYARIHNNIPDVNSIPSCDAIDRIYQILCGEGLVPEWKEEMVYGSR